MRLLQRANIGMRALDAIEVARKIERLFVRPDELHQSQISRCPPITLLFGAEIPISMLLVIRLTGDDVNRESAARQMIERCDLACQQGRSHEARPGCEEG